MRREIRGRESARGGEVGEEKRRGGREMAGGGRGEAVRVTPWFLPLQMRLVGPRRLR